jgi:DNA mismatch repair protein MutL
MDKIKILPINLVNQIAAGEVVERPHSIIKELVENSIDAGATSIEIKIKNGGKTFISVGDNGYGISKNDLALCLKPHATSKLNEGNLSNIVTLGFRGEALPSIASVSKINIHSREHGSNQSYQVYASNGIEEDIRPSSIPLGTLIQVSDLFYCVPARLNFLRTDGVETTYCYKTFKQIALANPEVSFKFENNDKVAFSYPAIGLDKFERLKNRALQILGTSFIENSIYLDEQNPMLRLYGFIGIPTLSKNTKEDQYIVVNNRSLKDRTISGLIKFAYSEVLFSGKQPCYSLFIDINPQEIDVNVSPTKSDIRFKDLNFIRHIMISSIKTKLGLKETQKTNNSLGEQLLNVSSDKNSPSTGSHIRYQAGSSKSTKQMDISLFKPQNYASTPTLSVSDNVSEYAKNVDYTDNLEQTEQNEDFPLGFAKAQFHKNWILAQNKDGLILVDQHAAHERVTQEIIKEQYSLKAIPQQLILTTEILKIDSHSMEIINIYKEQIESLGISFDIFGSDALLIKAIPSIVKNSNPKNLILDIISDFEELQSPENFNKKINNIISTIACHSSIRSGRIMNSHEMNDLLRIMEKTPNYAQCSHGRPTYISISLKDIEKMFSRN